MITILDALADSFRKPLDDFDGAIDALQEALVEHASRALRQHISPRAVAR